MLLSLAQGGDTVLNSVYRGNVDSNVDRSRRI